MGFIDAYKRLEKLCGEVMDDDRRISAYIEEMQKTPQGTFYVPGWEEDLKRLKHCRWVRNQIVHEPGCTEENMCEPDDGLWLEYFHSRIMNQTDPLALYRKATQPHSASVSNKQQYYPKRETPNNNAQSSGTGCMTWLIAILLMLLLIGYFLFS